MMDALLNEVKRSAESEMVRACLDHGLKYHSLHEGYGVLAEEVYEAEFEGKSIDGAFRVLLHDIRIGDEDIINTDLTEIARLAELAACEYIQIAAVAQKMLMSMKPEVTEDEA